MEYLTVKETAELKGCSERYIKTLCKDGKIQTEQELNCKGRMKYVIPISALPEDLQAKYYRQKRTESGVLPEKTDFESNE
ncbi:MAG: helix-turn-helix domain-containing protein, partial [Ruminococcus sp.]|nr:helix-turn-helix domain-containing protein [Ruminococcus sp.]